MSGVTIRKLNSEDSFRELTELLHRAYKRLADEGMKYVATCQKEDVTRDRCGKGECFVAELEGRLVGTVTLSHVENSKGSPWYQRPDVTSFGQFGVDPDHQGKGIGKALMDTIEERARENGIAELACDTSENATWLIEMYKARGYRFIEYIDWDVTNYRSVILSKALA